MRADRIALVGQWNLSAEVLTKWLALRDLADAQAYDGEERERKLELGVKEMMTRHLMLEAMQEVAQQKLVGYKASLEIIKERAAAGAALDIDIVRVETAVLESRSLITSFSRDSAVLKEEVCAYLAWRTVEVCPLRTMKA